MLEYRQDNAVSGLGWGTAGVIIPPRCHFSPFTLTLTSLSSWGPSLGYLRKRTRAGASAEGTHSLSPSPGSSQL